jgi:hypothetical protein
MSSICDFLLSVPSYGFARSGMRTNGHQIGLDFG